MAGDRRPVLSGELPFGCYSLYDELGLNKREANEMVEAFFDEIRGALSHSEQVKLSGFGNFDLRDKKERAGRNPKTGEEIPICARRVVTFRPGQKLKAKVEAYVASSNKQMGTDLKSVPAWSLEVGDRLQVRPHLKSIPGTARSKPSNNNELPAIPGKRYFAIGEVAELCAVKAHVLRYWEQEFPHLSPVKRRGNRRYYQRADVITIRQIRSLLYDQGHTIGGAKQQLSNASQESLLASWFEFVIGNRTVTDSGLKDEPVWRRQGIGYASSL
ncbi:integration host factor alpha subunit [Marinobacter sp. LV10MA510-1]|nr:integration host factor alpha subunit [Marinobacter sp. LV10MA510-1]